MILAVIQARMKSSRLPGKTMMDIHGWPMLRHVISGVEAMRHDKMVVATTNDSSDDVIERYCETLGVDCFREGLVGGRLYDWYLTLGEYYEADYIIRVCGDAPCVDPYLADILTALRCMDVDYWSWAVGGKPAVLTDYGIWTEMFRYDALVRGAPRKDHHQKHCTSIFYAGNAFKTCFVPAPTEIVGKPFRMTVDTQADIDRIREFAKVHGFVPHTWEDIVRYL